MGKEIKTFLIVLGAITLLMIYLIAMGVFYRDVFISNEDNTPFTGKNNKKMMVG